MGAGRARCGRRWDGEATDHWLETRPRPTQAPPSPPLLQRLPGPPYAYHATTFARQALHDYDAENDDELSIKDGDVITVLTQEDEGWWEGELNGKKGWFPSNFVEEIK